MTLTAKQEKFVQAWHATGNKTEAYRQAYGCEGMTEKSINANAHKVSKNTEVLQRFDELKSASQKRNETTVDTLDLMFKEAWKVARKQENASAMVSAGGALAKLHGLNKPDKQQLEHSGTFEIVGDILSRK